MAKRPTSSGRKKSGIANETEGESQIAAQLSFLEVPIPQNNESAPRENESGARAGQGEVMRGEVLYRGTEGELDAHNEAPSAGFEPGRAARGKMKVTRLKTPPPQTRVIKANPMRMGRDELNIIEHPFAALWQREPGDTIIFYEWEATHPVSGKKLPASWMVKGDAKMGLPTASDERLYLVLMELTREANYSQRVFFSRYDVIKRLGWDNHARSYGELEAGLERLKGVTIIARHSFWNAQVKDYINTSFSLIQDFGIKAERPGRKAAGAPEPHASFFTWTNLLFESFRNGYMRAIDLDFALSLDSDLALRLFRYLDKKAYGGRGEFQIELFNLCIGHLGMKPAPFPSKLKERLKRAHEELMAKGFLKSVAYEPMKLPHKTQKVCYVFGPHTSRPGAAAPLALGEEAPLEPQTALVFDGTADNAPSDSVEADAPTEAPISAGAFSAEQLDLLGRMEKIKVSSHIARELLSQWPASAIRHQLDCLADRKPKSQAATFVKSVREMWALPDDYVKRIEAQEREEKRRTDFDRQEEEKARQNALERQETARLEVEAVQLDAMWDKLDETTRSRIDAEVDGKLGIVGRMGKGEAARIAFRRAALRELLGQLSQGDAQD